MPKFKVGDPVERIGTLVPEYLKRGTVKRVIPHEDLPEDLTEYEIDFKFTIATFYQRQLKLAARASSVKDSK